MKERLTGAIILVVLIVLLVPELLSGPSRSAPAPQVAATSTEEPPLRSYTIDLADDPHGAAAPSATQEPPKASGPAQPTPVPDSGVPEQLGSADTTTPALASGTPAQPPSGPPPAAVSPRQTEEPSRQAAVQKRPAEKPVSEPRTEPVGGGWMVQLGVFANHANADRLAQELREKGFHPLVSQNGSGGRTLWRVRAGPVADRAAADQLGARLRAAGHAGSVVPQ